MINVKLKLSKNYDEAVGISPLIFFSKCNIDICSFILQLVNFRRSGQGLKIEMGA